MPLEHPTKTDGRKKQKKYLDLWHVGQFSAANFQNRARVGSRGVAVLDAAGLAVRQQRLVLHKLPHLRALAAAERVGEPELEAFLHRWARTRAAKQQPTRRKGK